MPSDPTDHGSKPPALGPLELLLALGPAVLGAVIANGGLEARSLDQGRDALMGALVGLVVGVVLVLVVTRLRRRP